MTFEQATKINKCKYFTPHIWCGKILNNKHCCGACIHHIEDIDGVYCKLKSEEEIKVNFRMG